MTSSFHDVLRELVTQLPHALGAVFVDWEGETVDCYSASVDKHDVQIAGAHWGIVHSLCKKFLEMQELGAAQDIVLRFTQGHVLISPVTREYFVVLLLDGHGDTPRAAYELGVAKNKLLNMM